MPTAEIFREQTQKYSGFYLGEVIDNKDPMEAGRVKVKLFGLFDEIPNESIPWARMISMPTGGSNGDIFLNGGNISRDIDVDYGSFIVPNIGAHVMCIIPRENPNLVYYLGICPGIKEFTYSNEVSKHTRQVSHTFKNVSIGSYGTVSIQNQTLTGNSTSYS